jgi:RNA polymerase sigma-70 factor (ECF subfamily)
MGRVRDARVGANRRGELERLYREQGDRMWRAVLAFAGDPEVASDALAETFAQALRRGSEIRRPERWLWRTVFRIAAGELKERGRRVPLDIDPAYEVEEAAVELVSALGQLSVKQRGAVVLHHAAGYPTKEIAAILDSTPAAVRVHLMRGRRRLRELLSEEEDA